MSRASDGWFYLDGNGQFHGPFPATEFVRRLRGGEIHPDWRVRRGEKGAWVKASQVKLKAASARQAETADEFERDEAAGMSTTMKVVLFGAPVLGLAIALLVIAIINKSGSPSPDTIYAQAEAELKSGNTAKAKELLAQYQSLAGADKGKAAALLASMDRHELDLGKSKDKDKEKDPGPAVPDDQLLVTFLNEAPKDVKPPEPRKLRIAVSPPAFDDMGKLLRDLGEGYSHFDEVDDAMLRDRLDNYDVLFFTCRGGGNELRNELEKWVARGGILYASDLRFDALQAAFPDLVDAALVGQGDPQTLEAEVLDPRLRERLGGTVSLQFDSPGWRPAAFKASQASALLRGTYRDSGRMLTSPLMVRFQYGKGVVIFTSFHNARINSDVGKELLRTVVFSLITATVESEIVGVVGGEGFRLVKHQLFTFEKTDASLSGDIKCEAGKTMRLALGFRNEGARFRLQIEAPGKKPFVREVGSTVIVEVADPPAGDWRYTVTAARLPYANFPFQFTVGQKKE